MEGFLPNGMIWTLAKERPPKSDDLDLKAPNWVSSWPSS